MEQINNIENTKAQLNDSFKEYLQPALLIGLITAFCYYIGYSYSSAFFSRFGIQYEFIDLPTSYYLMKSISGIILGTIIIYLVFFSTKEDTQNGRWRSFKENSIILLIAGLTIYDAIIEQNYFILAMGIFLVLFFITLVLSNTSWLEGFKGKFAIIFIALGIMSILSSFYGRLHAKHTIEGSGVGKTFIKIKTKTKIPDIDNTNNKFILIMHNDKKYYLVKQANPAPLNPLIYVIPDDQIEFVVLYRPIE